jgi:hypothetical protein
MKETVCRSEKDMGVVSFGLQPNNLPQQHILHTMNARKCQLATWRMMYPSFLNLP